MLLYDIVEHKNNRLYVNSFAEPGTSVSPTVNSSAPSGSASSTGESEPSENNTLCFSTTIGNLTNKTIETNLEKIGKIIVIQNTIILIL